jgi:Na+-exporting ATPase
MGIEVASPDVEESTEPPICGSNEEQSLSTTTKYRAHLLGVGDQEKVPTVTSVQPPLATDERVETPGTTLDRWNEQYTYAHTLSVAQVSQILGVDLKCVC